VELDHSFRVPADLDTVWQAVLDPERVAPCMPGATLSKVEGSNFSGTVKVKMGPISLLYKGSGEFLETDEQARRVVIKASGKDSRGNGTASATVTVTLRADGDATAGSVHTDLSITGKPAQFGRGMISEVGGKILNEFATCLASKLSGPEVAETSSDNGGSQRKVSAAGSEPSGNGTLKTLETKPRPAEPDAEPIDLLSYAGPSVVKRAAPVIAAVLAVLAIVVFRRRGR
jgi:uncharacterized protein